ncbi:MAG TPA: nuclear transport factor 2 family protein [Pyrinomonadaceae bacterium]|nr:nuclear transport factor 2 family protein [Pyrinomonadaceae bacterium]
MKPKVLRSTIVTIDGARSDHLGADRRFESEQHWRRRQAARHHQQRRQELINLSKEKWRWMSERKVDSLDALFHEKVVFVHMGATMTKTQELEVIKSGTIQYKTVEIQEASVRFIDKTAVLLNKIRLVAVVGGNEVTNPFMVTEVYVQQIGTWKLASLSFTRLLTQ